MSEEIVPAQNLDARKQAFMKQFEELRPDFFLKEMFPVVSERERAASELRRHGTRKAMVSAIPMKCRAEKCNFAETCPLQLDGIAPEGKKCHPAGTLIQTIDHGLIPIDHLDSTVHRLVGFERKYSAIRKGKAGRSGFGFSVQSKPFCGVMVSLNTLNGSHRATFDHVSVARFNKNAIGKFCVYLMRQGDFWRVGKTRLASEHRSAKAHKTFMNFTLRGHQEQADSMWILGIYDTNTEALLAEEWFSLTTKTSKSCFVTSLAKTESKSDGLYKWVTEEQLRDHHKSLIQPESHYREVLSDMGLSIDYPIWKREGFSDDEPELGPYVNWPMFIRSCNILPGVMDVPVLPDEEFRHTTSTRSITKTQWVPVQIDKEWYCGDVYALDVEVHKTYFAGNIATHNCPYEMSMVVDFMENIMEDLNVDPENILEVSMVRDLVNQEIQYVRGMNLLASEDLIQENVIGMDDDNRPIIKKELHLAVELEDKILKRKTTIRKEMLASREARAKAGQGNKDSAQIMSDMFDQMRELEIQREMLLRERLGTLGQDDYIAEQENEREDPNIIDAELVEDDDEDDGPDEYSEFEV